MVVLCLCVELVVAAAYGIVFLQCLHIGCVLFYHSFAVFLLPLENQHVATQRI